MKVLVDTGAFVALALRRDDRHADAVQRWGMLRDRGASLVTTEWVFGETVSFLRRRAGYALARNVGEAMRTSAVLEIVTTARDDIDRSWDLFLELPFPSLSLVDCVSFVVMRARRLKVAFTFDEHFEQAGFDRL